MTYTPQQWSDNDPTYPASATRFAYMEGGIKGLSDELVTAESRLDTAEGRLDTVESTKLDQAAGDTRYARRPQSMVVIGDSLTEQGGMIAANPHIAPNSAWPWANILLGQRFQILANLGIGGQTASQIRARFQDALDLDPGWIHLLAGTNDMGTAGGVAQAQTDITAMLDAAFANGVTVVLGTIPPRLPGNYTGSIKADTFTLNAWIIDQAKKRSGVILVDYFSVLADGTAGNFRATITGWNPTSDGIHLSATGGYACGKALADVLRPITTPEFIYANPNPGPNLLADPRFANGADNTEPSAGWVVSGSGAATSVWSRTARTDIPGSSWRTVVVPTGSTLLTIQGNASVGSNGLAVGDTVVGMVEFDASALDQAAVAGYQGLMAHLKTYDGTSFGNTRSVFSNYAQPNVARSGVLRTPALTIPAGASTVALFIEIAGGGTYSFDRAGVYKSSAFETL